MIKSKKFIRMYEKLHDDLDNIDDDVIERYRDTLEYWFEKEDFSKMDKLTIVYWHYKTML